MEFTFCSLLQRSPNTKITLNITSQSFLQSKPPRSFVKGILVIRRFTVGPTNRSSHFQLQCLKSSSIGAFHSAQHYKLLTPSFSFSISTAHPLLSFSISFSPSALVKNIPLTSEQRQMSTKSTTSSSVSGSETGSECVPSTAILPPENREEESPENEYNVGFSSETNVNPTENVSEEVKLDEDSSSSLNKSEKPPSDEVPLTTKEDQNSKVSSTKDQQQMSRKSTNSPSVSDSETGSDQCFPPSTVIPPLENKEDKSPENEDNAALSSERNKNPTENVSEEEKLDNAEGDLPIDPSTSTTSDAAKNEDSSNSSLNKSEKPPSDDETSIKVKDREAVLSEKQKNSNEVPWTTKEDQNSMIPATLLKPSPTVNRKTNSDNHSSNALVEEAWEMLKKSTITSIDNQVFVRDFVPSGLAYMMQATGMQNKPEVEIVKNFLLKTLHLQSWEKRVDNFTLAEGVMPASFKVQFDSHRGRDTLVADFGGSAIGRVAPVDSGFWWIILLRSYTKCTQDYTLSEMPEMQKGMRLILNLCLSDGFDTFPTLSCADGCSMIDRRMALFFFALRCARQMLKPECGGKELLERIDKRIIALRDHLQTYFWLDHTQLNNIYRYKTEEYSHTAVNKFNVIPDSIPEWVFDFMPLRGGYFIGNVSPARMDFRWFLIGNCIAILSSLATPEQETAIMDLFEERWKDLIGEMPLKIAYPALEGSKWRIVTGCDPKNTSWSYHNGGSWPVLIWLFTAACIKSGRPQIAKRAIELAEQRISKDGWPEYYDGKTGRYIGKQARKLQTWTISGYLVAKQMIANPTNVFLISFEEDKKTAALNPTNGETDDCMEALIYEHVDVMRNILESLVCIVDREDVLPNLQNTMEAYKNLEEVVKSESFLQFVNHKVWKQGREGRGDWDSLVSQHYSYINLRDGHNVYSNISADSNSICRSIGLCDGNSNISADIILCGYEDGTVKRFDMRKGVIISRKSYPPLETYPPPLKTRNKFDHLAWTIVGFIFFPASPEVIFASLDGCIFSLDLPTESISFIHIGNHEVEGTLIHFAGSKMGWVGLYCGNPNLSIKVWNEKRQIIYTGGGDIMGIDGGADLGQRVQGVLGRSIVMEDMVVVCTPKQLSLFHIEQPGVLHQTVTAEEGKEFIVTTFDCNKEVCQVVRRTNKLETICLTNLELINTFATVYTTKILEPQEGRDGYLRRYTCSGPVYAATMNNFYSVFVYSTGGLFCSPLSATSSRRRLEPVVKYVTTVTLDEKCVVATAEGILHLWYCGSTTEVDMI